MITKFIKLNIEQVKEIPEIEVVLLRKIINISML
jgi:hypothetical protein